MQDKREFQSRLPARISGIVFWGLTLIGVLVSILVISELESDLSLKNERNVKYLIQSIEDSIDKEPEYPAIKYHKGRILLIINSLRDVMGYTSVSLQEGTNVLQVGVHEKTDDVYPDYVHYHSSSDNKKNIIDLKIYYPNEKQTIADLRKNILLFVGISVFIFGFILQKILLLLISKPFLKMVETAEQFSVGNKVARFSENTKDEFGYLGGFINKAINKLVTQKEELNRALINIEKSEIELKNEKERAEVTLTSITDAVITVDVNEKIQFINPSAELLLGVSAADAHDCAFNDLVQISSDITSDYLVDPLHKCITEGVVYDLPEHSQLIDGNNNSIAIEASVSPMKDHDNELIGVVIVIQDVSHTRKLTKQLSFQASHDMLTGLYNRRKFEKLLSDLLINVKEEDSEHTFCYLDLDQFKIVNDTCGHIAGDELLRQVPDLFHQVLRSGDILARLGGDEFGILLENCNVQKATQISEKIRQKIKDFRFTWNDKVFEIGVSIGVVGITAENSDMTTILSSADVACYAAKDSGRNCVHVYESIDETVALRHGEMHWIGRIQQALKDDLFKLYKQPITNLANGASNKYEVLLRMIGEDGEIIPPGAFMPAAERYDLMSSIDKWVITKVFEFLSKNETNSSEQESKGIVSINLSGGSMNSKDILFYILNEKKRFGISLKNICFEITETVAISNLNKAIDFMESLKEYGCQFSLDDFGSGLSSFTYLKNLPVDYLKIDGAFVKNISHDVIDKEMLTSIHHIGEFMSLQTIAEKVENEETLLVLKEIGVNYVQGYYVGSPEPLV